jgi:hypothetical protein
MKLDHYKKAHINRNCEEVLPKWAQTSGLGPKGKNNNEEGQMVSLVWGSN